MDFEESKKSKDQKDRSSDENLRSKIDGVIKMFCNSFEVTGKDKVREVLDKDPSSKFIIAASHISNLDAPAAVEALGDILDIQITAESVLFKGMAPQQFMFKMAGKENFIPLTYKKSKGKKYGAFDPEDFNSLQERLNNGKTPWMAVHPFTTKETMQEARIGSIYLAQKEKAKIIPAALEYQGGSVSLEGALPLAKGLIGRLRNKAKAIYHVGEPITLPSVDVSIIDTVFEKRKNGKSVTSEERKEFSRVVKELREQAHIVAKIIAEMLPEDQRGVYSQKEDAVAGE